MVQEAMLIVLAVEVVVVVADVEAAEEAIKQLFISFKNGHKKTCTRQVYD